MIPIYPIVQYARLVGKNTAEFTAYDMTKFTKWFLKHHKSQEGGGDMVRNMKQKEEDMKHDVGHGEKGEIQFLLSEQETKSMLVGLKFIIKYSAWKISPIIRNDIRTIIKMLESAISIE